MPSDGKNVMLCIGKPESPNIISQGELCEYFNNGNSILISGSETQHCRPGEDLRSCPFLFLISEVRKRGAGNIKVHGQTLT